MRIGILGTRGIPNTYGGFEQFAQYLAEGLVKKGHSVWVYNSSKHPYTANKWNGVSLIKRSDPQDKIGTAGQFIYDFNCMQHARKMKFDILLQLGYTSNSIWHRLWPKDAINAVNMDGLEWKRTKYSSIVQKFLRYAESLAIKYADILISDSNGIQEYISEQYQKTSIYIPYGADIPTRYDPSVLNKWNLEPFGYYLIISRLEPENNIETVLKGYVQSSSLYPIVVIGSYENKFGLSLVKNYSNHKIIFRGPFYEQDTLNNLRHFSGIYFHGHSVGGTNPSLLEAMACKCNIAAHDNVFNQSVLEENAHYFSSASQIVQIINQIPDKAIIRDRQLKNIEKIKTIFNWEKIIGEYEQAFFGAINSMSKKQPSSL